MPPICDAKMDDHPLKTLLQLHLATDASTVLHLPYILQTLGPQTFNPPSVHTQKWTTRINSLIHSKDSGARWAGLSIALRTCMLSKPLMMECAQSWVGVALPMLSKNEAIPCVKACIRLLRYIFLNATAVPEFQRQVVTPNVAKFSQALHSLADRGEDEDLKILSLTTLGHLISTYPAPHRALHPSLSTLSLKFLNGSSPEPSHDNLINAAAQLYSTLPLSGGKVGASMLWRKSVDETITFTWDAFTCLRTTFPQDRPGTSSQNPQNLGDPIIHIPLNLDRLRCGIIVLCHLCKSSPPRPVQFPVGPLTKLCTALLSCSTDEQIEGYIDTTVRTMEISVIPAILSLGFNTFVSDEIVILVSHSTRFHITPHVTRLLLCIAYQLETLSVQRLPFLRVIPILLTHSHPLSNPIIPNRLIKAALPFLTVLLASESDVQGQEESSGPSGSKKKGKKRARGYEGDELFKIAREVICSSGEDGDEIIAAVEVIQLLLRDPEVVPAVHSLASRVLLSLYISLPRMSPAMLSQNLALHGRLCAKLQDVCIELGSGNASVMSKSLTLIAGIHSRNSDESLVIPNADAQKRLDLLLHPRLPPLVRSMPPLETLSLFRSQESQEEADLRKEFGIGHIDEPGPERSEPTPTEPPDHRASETVMTPSAPRRDDMSQEPQSHAPVYKPSVATSLSQAEVPRHSSTQPVKDLEQSTQKSAMQTNETNTAASTVFPSTRQDPPEPRNTIRSMDSDTAVANLDEDEEMPSIDLDSDSD